MKLSKTLYVSKYEYLMSLSSDFNPCNMDLRPSLYLTDQWFTSSLHSSVLFLFLSDGQQPIAPVPAITNLRAPLLYIRCQIFKREKVSKCLKVEIHFIRDMHAHES
jgi:hypothetical protein